MSFAIWQQRPPFAFDPADREQIYQVGTVFVVTDDPTRATQAAVDAVLNVPPGPDVAGFVQDAKAALGGIAQMADALGPSAALAYQALQLGQWDDCSTLIAAAKAKGTMSAAQYAGLQQLAAKHRVPLILP